MGEFCGKIGEFQTRNSQTKMSLEIQHFVDILPNPRVHRVLIDHEMGVLFPGN